MGTLNLREDPLWLWIIYTKGCCPHRMRGGKKKLASFWKALFCYCYYHCLWTQILASSAFPESLHKQFPRELVLFGYKLVEYLLTFLFCGFLWPLGLRFYWIFCSPECWWFQLFHLLFGKTKKYFHKNTHTQINSVSWWGSNQYIFTLYFSINPHRLHLLLVWPFWLPVFQRECSIVPSSWKLHLAISLLAHIFMLLASSHWREFLLLSDWLRFQVK